MNGIKVYFETFLDTEMTKLFIGITALIAPVFLMSCGQDMEKASQYKVEIKRTSHGIPHIIADDFGSLGFGEGFSSAEDHVCNIADAIVVARGERSKYHGAGENNKYLIADIAIRAVIPINNLVISVSKNVSK